MTVATAEQPAAEPSGARAKHVGRTSPPPAPLSSKPVVTSPTVSNQSQIAAVSTSRPRPTSVTTTPRNSTVTWRVRPPANEMTPTAALSVVTPGKRQSRAGLLSAGAASSATAKTVGGRIAPSALGPISASPPGSPCSTARFGGPPSGGRCGGFSSITGSPGSAKASNGNGSGGAPNVACSCVGDALGGGASRQRLRVGSLAGSGMSPSASSRRCSMSAEVGFGSPSVPSVRIPWEAPKTRCHEREHRSVGHVRSPGRAGVGCGDASSSTNVLRLTSQPQAPAPTVGVSGALSASPVLATSSSAGTPIMRSRTSISASWQPLSPSRPSGEERHTTASSWQPAQLSATAAAEGLTPQGQLVSPASTWRQLWGSPGRAHVASVSPTLRGGAQPLPRFSLVQPFAGTSVAVSPGASATGMSPVVTESPAPRCRMFVPGQDFSGVTNGVFPATVPPGRQLAAAATAVPRPMSPPLPVHQPQLQPAPAPLQLSQVGTQHHLLLPSQQASPPMSPARRLAQSSSPHRGAVGWPVGNGACSSPVLLDCRRSPTSPTVAGVPDYTAGFAIGQWFYTPVPGAPTAHVDLDAVRQMELDLPRTHPDNERVVARLGMVHAMLVQHIAEDPEIGYCQGLNSVAAVFAVAAAGKDEAYARFRAFTRQMRSLWLPGLPLVKEGSDKFVALAGSRPWFEHLEKHGVDPTMYLPQAWLPLFASWLPVPTLIRCLGLLERNGFVGVMALTLAVLDALADELLERPKMSALLGLLADLRQHPLKSDELLIAADMWIPAAADPRGGGSLSGRSGEACKDSPVSPTISRALSVLGWV
eukprot:TRINITY_DN63681_c0_g1_i1.p1 TRINITY_DN63681_c0_g1~~TRINITY_DN63681_c0_g1_i1.p1  ORF type:complete len:817 (-),score=131.37 TRINITY_DN63681_c0_g1_i1:36-2486(-)